jgi:hypothetical protein
MKQINITSALTEAAGTGVRVGQPIVRAGRDKRMGLSLSDTAEGRERTCLAPVMPFERRNPTPTLAKAFLSVFCLIFICCHCQSPLPVAALKVSFQHTFQMKDIHRPTQRAPLSCTSCASRKVRCSKTIPCRACLDRGTAANCKREVVLVRGRVRTADSSGSSPSVAELLLENARLSEMITPSQATRVFNAPSLDLTEYYEKRLHAAVGHVYESRTVACLSDIATPTQRCSQNIIDFADTWTSWVHFGCFFPEFRMEHEQMWLAGGLSSMSDPLWLSLYFAVLASALVFMSNEEFSRSETPLTARKSLIWNWYCSALFYLDHGDFLQRSHIRVVQAIVVLGNVASTIGETERHASLWAVAIRVAQQLNLGRDEMNIGESLVQQETRRRLWWTLVICDWLPIPFRTPCISDIDFNCRLPAIISNAQLAESDLGISGAPDEGPCPVQYHVIMAEISTIYYQLHAKLRLRNWSPAAVAEFVIQADDQLANVIERLPSYLQQTNSSNLEKCGEIEQQLPWIAIQRKSLVIALLYYRLAINRILQNHWLEGSTNFARSRSICLSSAVGLIRSVTSGDGQFSRLRSW